MPKISLICFIVPLNLWAAINHPINSFQQVDLLDLLQAKSPASIEEFISVLPEDLRKNFTLVRQSGSLQQASDQDPRAILWSEKGGFALSFNGSTDQRGGDKIEMMQFDFKNKKFHFSELGHSLVNGKMQWQAHESRACLQCHGPNPRPIWQEYPSWHNSYGSKDDFFQDSELPLYQQFSLKSMSHPRFQFLFKDLRSDERQINFPYRLDFDPRSTNPSTAFADRPNLRLGHFLQRLNAQRIFAMILAQPIYQSNADDVLAALMNCQGTSQNFPEILAQMGLKKADFDIRQRFDEPSGEQLNFRKSYFDGSATVLEYVAALIAAKIESNRAQFPKLQLRGLLDKYAAPIPRNKTDWPLFEVLDGEGKWLSLPYDRTDPQIILQRREPFNGGYHQQFVAVCSSLNQSWKASLSLQPKLRTGKDVLQDRCVYCHGSGELRAVFDSEASIKKLLASRPSFINRIIDRTDPESSADDRMPFLGSALSPGDRQLLIEYFNSLKP